MKELIKLQNGSDIRGISITTIENEVNLTPKEAKAIAVGMVRWLEREKNLAAKIKNGEVKIAIGHDSRLSATGLKEGMIEGFLEEGVHVMDADLATTPAMFMATQFSKYDCDASVMITASHLPYYFNGIKIFTKEGGAEHEDIENILEHAGEGKRAATKGTVKKIDLISMYAQDMVQKIREGIDATIEKPLQGFRIIVDAGNGAGGFFAKEVLEKLGADTTGSQFLEPDGNFPNHMPNPDNKEAMASIQGAVLKHQADLGVIFDTDVDRAAVVDKDGNALNRNNLIAVLATIVLTEHPKTTIVTNSPTSSHLKDFITELGGKQVRYLCGYRNVINKAIELNQAGISTELAIETSGHAAFKENYFLDDGAYVIAKILMLLPKLQKEGRTLGDLIADLKQPKEAQEVRFKIDGEDYKTYGLQVINKMETFIEEQVDFEVDYDNEEGIRSNVGGRYGSGWFLLRMSLHEPLLVLQVENDTVGKNKQVFLKLLEFFEQQKELNKDALKKIIE